jgi:hypothetical protein
MSSEISLDPDASTALAAGADACPHCGRATDQAWVVCAWCGKRLAASAELPPGVSLLEGRFVVRRVLGRGGFGITYAADDMRLQRLVAVKELFPDPVTRQGRVVLAPPHAREAFRAAKARFLREATVLARFSHPGIVRVFEVFEEHGTAYLVMELVDGRTLAEVLERRGSPFGEAEALDVAARVARALTEVHEAGVLHRDLNPSNVMVTGPGRLVVIDFGLAHSFAADRTGAMTRVVTPGYAPPEQYLGEARFGPPTDVYGLAATLYRLLTGRAPVSALDRQSGAVLPAPYRLNPSVSRLVSAGILDGLELQAAHRPATMAAFVARLGVEDDAALPARSLVVDVPPSSVTARPVDPPRARASARARRADRDATIATRSATRVQPDARPVWAPVRPESPSLGDDLPVVVPAATGWRLGVPALAATAALGSAAPVLVPLVLALLVLPALATAGDALTFVRVRREGDRLRLLHRAALPPFVPMRFIRNVGAVVYTAVPALLLTGLVVATVLVLDAAHVARSTQELLLRPAGAAVALLLAVPVVRNVARFRVGVVAAEVGRRGFDRAGGFTRFGLGLWLVALVLVVAGFAFHPELWPLGR